jgi:hypothetical protein
MNNTNRFENELLPKIRAMTSEQRKLLLSTIEKGEKLEEEALKQNPNLHLERQMKEILEQIKNINKELLLIKKNTILSNDTDIILNDSSMLDDNSYDCTSFFSIDMICVWAFVLLIIISCYPY